MQCTYSLTDYPHVFYLSYIPLHSLPQPRKYEWFLPDHKKEGIQRLVWFTYIDFLMGFSKRGWGPEGGGQGLFQCFTYPDPDWIQIYFFRDSKACVVYLYLLSHGFE